MDKYFATAMAYCLKSLATTGGTAVMPTHNASYHSTYCHPHSCIALHAAVLPLLNSPRAYARDCTPTRLLAI